MDRRDALKALAAVPALAIAASSGGVYGYMDVDRWFREGFYQRGAKVLLDGVDITHGCRWFDDSTGEAECFVYDAAGKFIFDGKDDAVTLVKRGRIEVVG